MARSRARAIPVPEHNALVASAVNMPPIHPNAIGKSQAWQGEAWQFYDRVGELRFVANWVGNVMSRATMVVAKDVDGVLTVQNDGPAVEALDAYYGGWQGQALMLQAAGVHLTVAGECYNVVADGQWATVAYDKVNGNAKTLTVDLGDGKRTPITGSESMTIRVWTPHPRNPYHADSPVRSNMGTLSEIATLSDHVAAQLESRLAGAGLLMMPSEIQFPTPKEADPAASQADQFMAVLAEAMMTPIKDRSSASAVVPIVVTAPGEFLNDVKHLTFWSPLDEAVIGMREAAVKRLALGLDTPPEVLLGLAESNHWNAWLVDEAAIKSHLEPRLQIITHAATTAYLRPALKGQVPDDDIDLYYVLADTSEIRLRPNRSREAIELFDRGELSGAAVRRETGFKPEDAPDATEMKGWLLRKIATGSTSPEQTQAALMLLGADLGTVISGQAENGEIPPRTENRRSLKDHPDNAIPDIDRSTKDRESRDGAVAAADALVYRALERVGNRLCNGSKKAELTDIPAHWRYMYVDAVPENAVDGAWAFATEVLDATGSLVDTARVCAALDGYVRFIVGDKRKHHRDLLEATLIAAGVIEP
jgi:hypothetical protein